MHTPIVLVFVLAMIVANKIVKKHLPFATCHALQNLSMWGQNPCYMEHHERGYPTVKTACQSAVWLQICGLLKKRTRFDALAAILGPFCNISIFCAQSSYRVVCGTTLVYVFKLCVIVYRHLT